MRLEVNPQLEIQAVRLSEDQLCVVVDDFLLNPQDAVDYACEHAAEFTMLERAYPGLVLPVEEQPLRAVYRFIRGEMSRLFPFCRSGLNFHTQMSLATLQPEEFTWIQRLCHSDPRLEPGRVNFAALLYLFHDPAMGGTGFFRWRNPEYWQRMTALQRDDPQAGLEELRSRFRMFREAPCYMSATNEAAELIDTVPARFNRLVFYSGELPHNASITDPSLLSADPARGRLTLNCFVSALPKNQPA